MSNKHPILILLFVMLTSLAFAATTVTASHVIYGADDVVQDVAIVGSRVHFMVNLESDAAGIDSVKIKSDTLIGDTSTVGLTLSRRSAYSYEGDYVVKPGKVKATENGVVYQVFVYVKDGSYPLNTTESYRLKIDNQIPVISNNGSTKIESVPPGKDVFGIGDEMRFVFKRNQNPATTDVVNAFLDLSSIGGPDSLETTRNNDEFTANYILTEYNILKTVGQLEYIDAVTIPITMIDSYGNVSDNTDTSNVIKGDANGRDYPADRLAPSFAGISDIQANGQYRFSP